MYTVKEAFSRKNRFHCTLSYSFDDLAHVVQRLRPRSQRAWERGLFGNGLMSLNQVTCPCKAKLYAPRLHRIQLITVAAVAGSIIRQNRLNALLERPDRATSWLPARACLMKPRELTKPVRRKKMERLARPEMMRRTMGSWKNDGSPWGLRAGDWSSPSRDPNRWPVTMKRAVMPRRPFERQNYQLSVANWSREEELSEI